MRAFRTIHSSSDQHSQLTALGAMLQDDRAVGTGTLKMVSEDGVETEVPRLLLPVLRQLVVALLEGKEVALVLGGPLITTQQAADILNVSRPYMVKLLEEGKLPFTRTGKHRRIRMSDLMFYKAAQDAQRRGGLADLTRLGEEMGDYDQTILGGVRGVIGVRG